MDDDTNKTLYVGNLGNEVTEDILYELFLQAGPVTHVRMPLDKTTKQHKHFGFVCFKDECSASFAVYLLDSLSLFGKSIKVQSRRKSQPLPLISCVGIHSLDPEAGSEIKTSTTSIHSPELSHSSFPYHSVGPPYDFPMFPKSQGLITPPTGGGMIIPQQVGFIQQGEINLQGEFNHHRRFNQQEGFNQERGFGPQGGFNRQRGFDQQSGLNKGYQGSCFDARSIIDTNRLNNFKNTYDVNHSQPGDEDRQRHSRRTNGYGSGDNHHRGRDRQRSEPNYRCWRNDSYDRSDKQSGRFQHHRSESYRENDRYNIYDRRNDRQGGGSHHYRSDSYRDDDRRSQSHRRYTSNRY